jgi:hypothetical protein
MKTWKWIVSAVAIGALGLAGTGLADEQSGGKELPGEDFEAVWAYLLGKYDADADGVITRREYGGDDLHWDRLDKDGSGTLEKTEGGVGVKFKTKPGRKKTVEAPKVGAFAPLFELEIVTDVTKLGGEGVKTPKVDGKRPEEGADGAEMTPKGQNPGPTLLSLKSFRDQKPVALIFGSYT